MPPPLNLTINLYEQVRLCLIRARCQSQTAAARTASSPGWIFQPLKLIWGYRLLPVVGPGFKVFKEEVLSVREEKKCLVGEQPATPV